MLSFMGLLRCCDVVMFRCCDAVMLAMLRWDYCDVVVMVNFLVRFTGSGFLGAVELHGTVAML